MSGNIRYAPTVRRALALSFLFSAATVCAANVDTITGVQWDAEAAQQIYLNSQSGASLELRGTLVESCAIEINGKSMIPDAAGHFVSSVLLSQNDAEVPVRVQCYDEAAREWKLRYHWRKASPFFRVRMQDASLETPTGNATTDEYLELTTVSPPPLPTRWQKEVGVGIALEHISPQPVLPNAFVTAATVSAAATWRRDRWAAGLSGRLDALDFTHTGAEGAVRAYQFDALAQRRYRAFDAQAGARFLGTLGSSNDAGFHNIYGLVIGGVYRRPLSNARQLSAALTFAMLNGGSPLPAPRNPMVELGARYEWKTESSRRLAVEAKGQWASMHGDPNSVNYLAVLGQFLIGW